MKGRVLGYDGSTGAISGEHGERYSFKTEDWKAAELPRDGASVDFVVEGNQAREIYLARSSFPIGGAGGEPINSEAVVKARATIAARPQVAIEVLMIVVSGAFSFMSAPRLGAAGGFSLFGVGAAMSDARNGLAMGSSPPAELSLATFVGYLLWLIPIGAAYLLYCEFKNVRNQRIEFAVGAAAAASILYVLLAKAAFSAAMSGMGMGGMGLDNAAASVVGFGFGSFLVPLCGVGLIMTARGKLTRTPGL